jgi:hypothetical protein
MFIRRMTRIHRRGKEALALHRLKHQDRTGGLIRTLRDVVAAYQTEGGAAERLAAISSVLSGKGAEVVEQCEAHEANAGNNHPSILMAVLCEPPAHAVPHLARYQDENHKPGFVTWDEYARMVPLVKSPAPTHV